MEDRDLIERCLEQQEGAWETFLERFSSLIYSLSHKCLRSRTDYKEQDIEDVLENVLMALLEHNCKLLREYDDSYKFSTWLGVIVRTQVGRFLRKKKERMISLEDLKKDGSEDRIEALGTEDNPESIQQEEDIDRLKDALGKLKYKERMILTLAYFDQKDYKEISEILDISINSVGAYLFRAKSKLSQLMGKRE